MSKVHQIVADTIIARLNAVLENSEKLGQWEKPFTAGPGGGHYNVISSKPYRGINQFLLTLAGGSNCWGTFKQWKTKNASVRKGEHGSMIVFYKTSTYEDNDGNEKTVPILRYYKVFASSQVDGYEAPTTTTKPVNPVDAIAAVDRFIANLHIETREASGRAFYSPSRDFVSMPPQNDFSKTSTSTATENYYSTFLHECTHATGHKSRCDRQLGGFFGDPEYAFEELVAELGAAMACASLGITDAVREDHCRYIRSWLKAIKDNPRAIFKASSLAQKAVDWMHAQQENQTAIAA